jgi:hypothetical protein
MYSFEGQIELLINLFNLSRKFQMCGEWGSKIVVMSNSA